MVNRNYQNLKKTFLSSFLKWQFLYKLFSSVLNAKIENDYLRHKVTLEKIQPRPKSHKIFFCLLNTKNLSTHDIFLCYNHFWHKVLKHFKTSKVAEEYRVVAGMPLKMILNYFWSSGPVSNLKASMKFISGTMQPGPKEENVVWYTSMQWHAIKCHVNEFLTSLLNRWVYSWMLLDKL